MRRWLVFGLSGMLGRAIAPHLPGDCEIVAPTRQRAGASVEGVQWLYGSLPGFAPDDRTFDVILSLGPLDLFAEWFATQGIRAERIVAISSCSLRFKAASTDAGERDVAARLQHAEEVIFAVARERGIGATILRPTLIYGNGMDRSLTPLLAFARRWRVLPLPARAGGLRQPVHVDDVAQAVFACLDRPASIGMIYELPGAESLDFDTMMRRMAHRHLPGVGIVALPNLLFRLLLALGLRVRGWDLSAAGIVQRLAQDQTADASAAKRDLGFSPRTFAP